jgi:hypothetical protein
VRQRCSTTGRIVQLAQRTLIDIARMHTERAISPEHTTFTRLGSSPQPLPLPSLVSAPTQHGTDYQQEACAAYSDRSSDPRRLALSSAASPSDSFVLRFSRHATVHKLTLLDSTVQPALFMPASADSTASGAPRDQLLELQAVKPDSDKARSYFVEQEVLSGE